MERSVRSIGGVALQAAAVTPLTQFDPSGVGQISAGPVTLCFTYARAITAREELPDLLRRAFQPKALLGAGETGRPAAFASRHDNDALAH
jgi:hypothetical protein